MTWQFTAAHGIALLLTIFQFLLFYYIAKGE